MSRTITATRTVARRRLREAAAAVPEVVQGDPSASPKPKNATAQSPSVSAPVRAISHDASRSSWLSFFYSLGGDTSAPRSDAAVIALRARKGARELAEAAELADAERALAEQANEAIAALEEQD